MCERTAVHTYLHMSIALRTSKSDKLTTQHGPRERDRLEIEELCILQEQVSLNLEIGHFHEANAEAEEWRQRKGSVVGALDIKKLNSYEFGRERCR